MLSNHGFKRTKKTDLEYFSAVVKHGRRLVCKCSRALQKGVVIGREAGAVGLWGLDSKKGHEASICRFLLFLMACVCVCVRVCLHVEGRGLTLDDSSQELFPSS